MAVPSTCPECGSHELDKCLGRRIGCTVVGSVSYELEEHEAGAGADEEIEVADAEVSVRRRSDGSEARFWGVDNRDDAYSWFRPKPDFKTLNEHLAPRLFGAGQHKTQERRTVHTGDETCRK